MLVSGVRQSDSVIYIYIFSDYFSIYVIARYCIWFSALHSKSLLFIYFMYSRICQRRQWHPTPVLLPGKSHGQRSLVGCSPSGCEESDMTERLHFHFSLSGEGNGNPLQCSCLGNPRDGGAWWAAIYGVAEGWTRLK